MMAIDLLLQTLHGRGPLAPLFIEGDELSIRSLLDELASQGDANGVAETKSGFLVDSSES